MKSARELFLVVTVALLSSVPSAGGAEHSYVGSNKCKACHLKEYKSWSETRMANALDLLRPGERAAEKKAAGLDPNRDYTGDRECLPCHVTGHGKPGGFTSLAGTPELAGVGCEMCHGPGGTYTRPEHMSLKNKEYKKASLVAVGLVGEIKVDQCRNCHNAKSPFVGDDYVFDFAKNREKGTHERFPLKYKH